jgi:Uncharacterized protein conserved in bacteria
MKIKFRQLCRIIHRDLSFFFSGMILIYAISGFFLNHKGDFNAEYDITQTEYQSEGVFPVQKEQINKAYVLDMLNPLGEADNYTKYYFPSEGKMKVFIKGGSSLVLDMKSGVTFYESVKKRHVISALNRLHYNPNRNWTIFSDIFATSLIIIILSGILMMKGTKGLWGRGGIELLIGVIIPLLFVFL